MFTAATTVRLCIPPAHSIAVPFRHRQLQASHHIVLVISQNIGVHHNTHIKNLLSSYRTWWPSPVKLNDRASNCFHIHPHTLSTTTTTIHTMDPHPLHHTCTHPGPSMARIEGGAKVRCTCQGTHLASPLCTPLGKQPYTHTICTARCLAPPASWSQTAHAFTSAHTPRCSSS